MKVDTVNSPKCGNARTLQTELKEQELDWESEELPPSNGKRPHNACHLSLSSCIFLHFLIPLELVYLAFSLCKWGTSLSRGLLDEILHHHQKPEDKKTHMSE